METTPKLQTISSIKFEIYLPVGYTDSSGRPLYVQINQVSDILSDFISKYKHDGGYTLSNPAAPPPYEGSFPGYPNERMRSLILVFPDHLFESVLEDIKRIIALFEDEYNQQEIFTVYHHVNRLIPEGDF